MAMHSYRSSMYVLVAGSFNKTVVAFAAIDDIPKARKRGRFEIYSLCNMKNSNDGEGKVVNSTAYCDL